MGSHSICVRYFSTSPRGKALFPRKAGGRLGHQRGMGLYLYFFPEQMIKSRPAMGLLEREKFRRRSCSAGLRKEQETVYAARRRLSSYLKPVRSKVIKRNLFDVGHGLYTFGV